MFFSISHNDNLDFPHQWQHCGITVNTDAGWHQITMEDQYVVYKGYAESEQLVRLLPEILAQKEPQLFGNFCAIVIDNNSVKIKTDRYRSFPLWVHQGKEITNLTPLTQSTWADSFIEADLDLSTTEHKFDVIGPIHTSLLSESQVIDQIDQILLTRTQNFVKHNQLPIKSFLTGGVDSLLVYSYLKRIGAKVEVIEHLHIDYDHFWRCNSTHLKKFWGYSQIHHWNEATVLASGAPGDEFMLRSPTTSNMYLQHNNTSIPELLKINPTCLHYEYFCQDKHQLAIQRPYAFISSTHMSWDICNNIVNDWQHWHIGNTLTWTLLRDLDLIKLMLRLPLESAIDQILHSSLSKKLIERNLPGASAWISDQKNTGSTRKNLGRRLETRNEF